MIVELTAGESARTQAPTRLVLGGPSVCQLTLECPERKHLKWVFRPRRHAHLTRLDDGNISEQLNQD